MSQHEKINYVEFPAKDMAATETFFTQVFAWQFTYYGPEYMAFSNAGLDGGFYQSGLTASTQNGSALVVFYSDQLEATEAKILAADGNITQAIFEFPGGRRFHFCDPNGNEFAVWSDLLE